MKNSLMITLVMLFATTSLFSQNLPKPTKWKLKKVGISFGADMDMVNGMDGNYLLGAGKNVNVTLPEGINLRDGMYGGICENPHIRITAALEVPKLKNTELQLGVNAFVNRVDGAYYQNESEYIPNENGIGGSYDSEYIGIDNYSHEFGLEGALVRRLSLGFINVYGGVGTNLGYSIGGDLYINGNNLQTVEQNMNRSNSDIITGTTFNESNYASYESKDAFHQRAFLQAGVSLLFFKRMEIGIDWREGVGYKTFFDGPTRTTRLHSVGLTTKWVLK